MANVNGKKKGQGTKAKSALRTKRKITDIDESIASTDDDPSSNNKVGSSQDQTATSDFFEPGRVYEVPVESVRSNPYNPRVVYTDAAVNRMAISLQSTGQRISATGYADEHGGVTLIEGETRLRAARSVGLPTLRIEIRPQPKNDRALYEEARAANVVRQDQTPLDDAIKWRELLAKKVYPTQISLAKALHLREDHVSRILSLANLSSLVIHAIAQYPDLLNSKMLIAIREYWELRGDKNTLELIQQINKQGMGYRDVTLLRKNAEKGPVKRPRALKETVDFQGHSGELRTFEHNGRLELHFQGLTPAALGQLTTALMSIFSEDSYD